MVDWSIETLRDLSPILAIVFFITSTILVLKLRSKKSLAYEKVTDSTLIVGEAIKSKVDILFNGEKVEDVHLLEVKIMNNGNEHVKEEDYKKPITSTGYLRCRNPKHTPQNLGHKHRLLHCKQLFFLQQNSTKEDHPYQTLQMEDPRSFLPF